MEDIVYIVRWIEIEFGQRDQGFKIYIDLDLCIKDTKYCFNNGSSYTGYFGPIRPASYYKTEWEILEMDVQKKIRKLVNNKSDEVVAWSSKKWEPYFKSSRIYIN